MLLSFVKFTMKHASEQMFGQARSAGPVPEADKWLILRALSKAADDYGLSHRNLNVLSTLLSFLPDREIAQASGVSVVFASNRAISDRLNGMPESTLRRHLAQLLASGLVSRRASPNGKRYARRLGGERIEAYGFDLAPLALEAPAILERAAQVERHGEELRLLRDRVSLLCGELAGHAPEAVLATEARKLLRRKPDMGALRQMIEHLTQAIAPFRPQDRVENPARKAPELSGSDSQNERHIQYSNIDNLESEGPDPRNADPSQTGKPAQGNEGQTASIPNIGQVIAACQELRTMHPEPIRHWADISHLADRFAPMIGIGEHLLNEARQVMGEVSAAISVLCILERHADIRTPPAYLRSLVQRARQGSFTPGPMVRALLNRATPEAPVGIVS
ncbi:hypothetical protein LCGC14_2292130 [marine sediment metagenome]|uniref:Uncharacterized protein n=1 Tax=marine sediment metagenome TaxID=412755 RepID=A0A0F9CRL1_9ZZZZ